MFKKSQLTSKKFVQKKRKFFLIKSSFLLLLVILLFVSFFYIVRLKNITISDVELKGNVIVGTEELLSFVNAELEGNFYAFFPKKNILFYPKEKIENEIKEKWKRIESVTVERKGLTAVAINVIEKKPKFLWCGAILHNITEEGSCYFIDDNGYIFSKAPGFRGDVYFRFFGNVAAEDPVGEYYLEASRFHAISDFVLKLDKAEIKASELLAKENREYELYLGDGTKVFISDRQNLEETFENLRTLLTSEVFKKEVKNSLSPLDYIDLRYGNKVYYRFKQT